jgi:hypothetical protein
MESTPIRAGVQAVIASHCVKGNSKFHRDFMLLHQDFAILHALVHMGTGFMPCKVLERGLSRNTGPTSHKSFISAQLASWDFTLHLNHKVVRMGGILCLLYRRGRDITSHLLLNSRHKNLHLFWEGY